MEDQMLSGGKCRTGKWRTDFLDMENGRHKCYYC